MMQSWTPPDSDPIVNIQTAGAPPVGRPVIRRAPEAVKPGLPQGYTTEPNPQPARPTPGLPAEFTMPDKWERAGPADLQPLGLSGPYLINRKTGDVKLVDVPKNDPTKKTDPRSAGLELRNVIDSAFRAKELSRNGWFATGFGSGLSQKAGGTSAADVKGKLDTIGANTAFEQLQKMRDNSPTGGALGAITERELDLLKSTIASLDQAQSDGEFQGAMQKIAESYGRVLMKLPGGRAMMIERGWLPKVGGKKPSAPKVQPRAQKARVINFDDLPE